MVGKKMLNGRIILPHALDNVKHPPWWLVAGLLSITDNATIPLSFHVDYKQS